MGMESASDACQRDRSKAESIQEKACQRVEALRDAMAGTTAALTEAGSAFAESLYSTQDQPVSAAALKALQQTAKASFRQTSTSWTRARQLQEAWLKASSLRRRAAKKASMCATGYAEADA